jgi:predicted RNA-binding Zn-ribbon protein involved in translation (DUF1610 family)
MVKPKTSFKRMSEKMKKTSTVYVVDLTRIDGNGDFLCPQCGAVISPEDETETTYIIQEVKMKKNDQLEELIIKCKNCESIIHITGFTSL